MTFEALQVKIAEVLESRSANQSSFSRFHFSDAVTISCYLRDEKIQASLADINDACNELTGRKILQKRIEVNHELGTTFAEFRFNQKKETKHDKGKKRNGDAGQDLGI